MKMDHNATLQQSKNAYNQWKDIWRANATYHSKFPMRSLRDFQNIGIGKAVLCIATGYSFEENIETIKKHQGNVDIMVCDKSLKSCIEHGITPTFCVVADANVDAGTYLEPVKDKMQDTILVINVCANTKWVDGANWKSVYFVVNMDVINSEIEFSQLSGCPNMIPAATNVSNAMVVLLTQCDNNGRKNFFGYDKILLIGFDYCWKPGGSYYAFNKTGNGKHNYMRHVYLVNKAGELCFSSSNLIFSARWLEKYISTFNLLVVSCTKNTILTVGYDGDLESQMQYRHKTKDQEAVKKLIHDKNKALAFINKIDENLKHIGRDHYFAFRASV